MNPTNRCTEEDAKKWIAITLEKENFKNYTVNVSGSSEKGDGYLGDITFVDVRGDAGSEEAYSFVIKSGKKSNQLREKMPIKSAFENEMYFYNSVLPTFLEFQEEKAIKEPFKQAAKCYNTLIFEDIEVLVLENLRKSGYSLWDRTKPMNSEHVREIIKIYGKLHAISFALRDQRPTVFRKLSEELKDVLKLMDDELLEEGDVYSDLINIAKAKGEFGIAEKASLLQKQFSKINDLTDPNDPFAVIVHGDCWNNNFMFKYNDAQKTKLSEVCFLDFQLCRLASPVYDLSYFLFTCAAEEDIQNFDEIMNVYYKSFSDFLRQLGSDPLKMFPFEELMNQWRKYGKFGVVMCPSLIRVCLSDKEDVADLVEAVESGGGIMDAFSYSVKNTEEYARRTFPPMKLAIERNFI